MKQKLNEAWERNQLWKTPEILPFVPVPKNTWTCGYKRTEMVGDPFLSLKHSDERMPNVTGADLFGKHQKTPCALNALNKCNSSRVLRKFLTNILTSH